MRRPPLLFGGLAMLAGWVWGALRGEARYGDASFRHFLRHYHSLVLRHGKEQAMERVIARPR
jgi:hypothetical protein